MDEILKILEEKGLPEYGQITFIIHNKKVMDIKYEERIRLNK